MTRKETGDLGERVARDFLKKRGYRIVETNFRCREGEIDIVARQRDCLVFVEVRTKSGPGFGSTGGVGDPHQGRAHAGGGRALPPDTPGCAVRLRRMAHRLRRRRDGARGKPARVELIQNAVGEE